MYVPASFRETEPAKLHDFIRAHSFGILISLSRGTLVGSHLPFLLETGVDGAVCLVGHLARANPHWREIAGESLVIFPGPHTYVSPTWYEDPGTVPTWNYVAVHVTGMLQLVEDPADLLAILQRSVAYFESSFAEPWTFSNSAPEIELMLKAIVGFRVEIRQIEGKWKLNQNHPEARRRKVIAALQAQPDDDSQAIAGLMSQTLES